MHGQWFSGLHLGLSLGGAIVTIVELRGGVGVAYHMHFAYIVLHNIMYRYTAIDVFNTKG